MKRTFLKILSLSVFAVVSLSLLQCAADAKLPKDISGLSVGMSKDAAQKRLEAIATFERDEEKRQQLWRLNGDARFNELAIGYDKENQVRYITAFVDKATAKEKIKFSDVGNISKAKQEIVPPHYRYIWEVPAADDKPAYFVNAYGDNPESVTMFTLNRKYETDEIKNDSEEEEDE